MFTAALFMKASSGDESWCASVDGRRAGVTWTQWNLTHGEHTSVVCREMGGSGDSVSRKKKANSENPQVFLPCAEARLIEQEGESDRQTEIQTKGWEKRRESIWEEGFNRKRRTIQRVMRSQYDQIYLVHVLKMS